ncbi:hypothetical protein GJ744_012250 [Endocarpon pusillum]|uniref:Uncharacterized protein n=1 Tax=Endocarpon pusillum TaxID=364733 RepID=A0A8H7ADJ7_9EURO|nr:hypothetical protein GJ744_012250 [Endocarpon pusillum]
MALLSFMKTTLASAVGVDDIAGENAMFRGWAMTRLWKQWRSQLCFESTTYCRMKRGFSPLRMCPFQTLRNFRYWPDMLAWITHMAQGDLRCSTADQDMQRSLK